MTKNQLLRLLAIGRIAEKRIEGNREVWRVREEDGYAMLACGPAVYKLKEARLIWTHYPTGHASAGINDAGKFQAFKLNLATAEELGYPNPPPVDIPAGAT